MIVNVAVVAPEYTPPLVTFVKPLPVFTCHWYVGEVPVAATVKLALSPEHMATLAGCVVMATGVLTVSVTQFDVTTLPQVVDVILTLYARFVGEVEL